MRVSKRYVVILATVLLIVGMALHFQWEFALTKDRLVALDASSAYALLTGRNPVIEHINRIPEANAKNNTANATQIASVATEIVHHLKPLGQRVCLFAAIHSVDRETRQTLRDSWLLWAADECFEYRFIIPSGVDHDSPIEDSNKNHEDRGMLIDEQSKYKDLYFVEGKQDREKDVTRRVVLFMDYMHESHDYDYFMAVNGNTFLCIKRMMNELRNTKRTKYINGKIFCLNSRQTAYEDDYVVMSRDIVQHILLRRRLLDLNYLCTFGESVILWTSGTPLQYNHERRIYFQKEDTKQVESRNLRICRSAIGLQNTNPKHLMQIWDYEKKTASVQIDPVQYIMPDPLLHCPYFPGITTATCKIQS
eukprot:TRINITY_DN4849_c0_g1_i1.p1 TRINITY_DN4849_c0_g1~~TRINITY_DN4849_c0_g1_i1.p1  ORF type:complete len:364 (-),score=81.18 TRINITY_DN4849_c0_g1_i1:102-1193(-)